MASSQLPEDILLEILARLPAKSLLRFSCVCKTWNNLLKNPYFIDKNAAKNPSMIYLRSRRDISVPEYKEQLFELNSDNPIVYRSVRIPDHEPYFRVNISSCKGIICLEDSIHGDFGSNKVCLYNPITRKDLTLPPSLFDDQIFVTHYVGFGFDKCCNDYKVIRVMCAKTDLTEDETKRKLEEGRDLYVATLDDSLAVFSSSWNFDEDHEMLAVDVWVMESSSWTKKICVELGKFSGIINIGVHGNSLLLLCNSCRSYKTHVLVDCSPDDDGEGEGCKKLKVRTVLEYDDYRSVNEVIFRPSLVSLPESEIHG